MGTNGLTLKDFQKSTIVSQECFNFHHDLYRLPSHLDIAGEVIGKIKSMEMTLYSRLNVVKLGLVPHLLICCC